MLSNPDFVSGLKLLAQAGMVLETANQTPGLIDATLRTTDKVPGLRIVIDHLPQMEPPTDSAARGAYESNLRELAKRPQVWLKVSEVIRPRGWPGPHRPELLQAAPRRTIRHFRRGPCPVRQRFSEQRPVGHL